MEGSGAENVEPTKEQRSVEWVARVAGIHNASIGHLGRR